MERSGGSPAAAGTHPKRILIIGAGPTAMGFLHRLFQLRESGAASPGSFMVEVIEQENEVGGLARTVTDESGFSWDLGVHVTGASKYPEFLAAVDSVVPEWRVVRRCVKADMSGHVVGDDNRPGGSSSSTDAVQYQCHFDNYVPYPVQNSIPYFEPRLKTKCLADIEKIGNGNGGMSAAAVPQSGENFGHFSQRVFGPTLQSIFIRPYNEKVWTVALEEMSTRWVEGRVPRISPQLIRHRCEKPLRDVMREDRAACTLFRYPSGCKGIGEMWSRFAAKFPFGTFRLGEKVVEIDVNQREVKTEVNGAEKTSKYDVLISTIPITELGKLTGLMPALNLRHSKVILVGLGLDSVQSDFTRELTWAYYPHPSTIFYRCTILSNFSRDLVPTTPPPKAHYWSALCEIGISASAQKHSHVDSMSDHEIVERSIEDLVAVGVLKSRGEVCSRWVKRLPHGYPIPTLDRDGVLSEAHSILESHSIYSRGRFGGWKYEISNQDHSFECGLQLVDRLMLGIPESLYTCSG